MRSSLTRNVFRQILNNEPLAFSCARNIRSLSTVEVQVSSPTLTRRLPRSLRWTALQRQQKRTFLGFSGFSRKPQRVEKKVDFAPGLMGLLQLRNAVHLGHRKPERKVLVEAWEDFTTYKLEKKEPMLSYEVEHIMRALKYLRDTKPHHKQNERLSKHHLTDVEKLMAIRPNMMDQPALEERYELAKALADEFDKYLLLGKTEEELVDYVLLRKKERMAMYLSQLIMTGHTSEALDSAEEWVEKSLEINTRQSALKRASLIWTTVLQAIGEYEQDEAVLKDALARMNKCGVQLHPLGQAALVKFYAKREDFDNVQHWYERDVYKHSSKEENDVEGPQPASISDITLSEVLDFCARNGKIEWGNSVFRKALNSNPDKPSWDALFLWVAATPGKGVEDIERMVGIMKKHNVERPEVAPDIATFNGLAKFAMSKDDPYLAERYLALAQKLGIYPNAQTYILQMNYRIDAGDLTGVQAAYSLLQAQEITEDEDIPVLNKYVQALCDSETANYNQITTIVTDLEERETRLQPATVRALCALYLEREELENITDICNVHTNHFTGPERDPIIKVFMDFIFDRENDAGIAYEVYTILRVNFSEIKRDTRHKIMQEFFQRGEANMGIHVFGHMRQDRNYEKRPTIKEYVSCFEGIAGACDIECLATVHNMMKLDSSIDVNTTIYNALMLAYTSCGEPFRALNFWHDITISREGPNYRSLEIVFFVCEKRPFGDEIARDIWATMRRMEIDITRDVFSAFADSLAGHVKFEECFALIEGAEQEFGIKPDAKMLGSIHNAAPGRNRKEKVEAWAERVYPKLWQEMKDTYVYMELENEFVGRLYNIPRNVKA